MSDESPDRLIEIHLAGQEEPIWAVRDVDVPLPGDQIGIEQADGTTRHYEVVKRIWLTAKQGEHSFARVRLSVKDSQKRGMATSVPIRGFY